MAIPRLIKGSEVRYFHPKEIELYEKHHRMLAKHIQRLPPNTPNATCLSTLGWQPILNHIEKMKLLFLGRILRRPAKCIYKRVFLFRFFFVIVSKIFSCESPAAQIVDICLKYDILKDVIDIILSGTIPPKDRWSRMVKHTINNVHLSNWRLDVSMYSHLRVYRKIFNRIHMCCWLSMCKLYPKMTKIFTTVLRLINGTCALAAYCGSADKKCRHCTSNQDEDLSHFILFCPLYEELREQMKENIINSVSHDTKNILYRLSIDG